MRLIDADALWHDMETAEWYNNADRDEVAEPLILSSQTVGEWISVKDRLPKNQKPVIVYVPPHINEDGDEYFEYVGMAYYTYSVNGGYWCGTDGDTYGAIGEIATPTHWMPLLKPPEEVKASCESPTTPTKT